MMGTSSVQPSMCQSNVPFRYAAAGFLSGLSVTRKISGFSPRPSFSTVPSLRLNATWASSSRCRSRKMSAPFASRASSVASRQGVVVHQLVTVDALHQCAHRGCQLLGLEHGHAWSPFVSSPLWAGVAVDLIRTLYLYVNAVSAPGRGGGASLDELRRAAVEPPGPLASGGGRRGTGPTSCTDQPVLPLQEEEHVAAGPGLVVVPVGDVGVDDDVALGPTGHPLGVGPAEGVVALVGPESRDLDRCRPGRRWRRRRRSDRRPGPGRRRPGWPGRPLRPRRGSSSAPSPVSRVVLRGRGRRPAARAG